MSEAVVEFAEVAFGYDAETVLHDVDLRVPAGMIYGLVGPDGAGKTTLLRLACGQLTPSRGHARVLGADPRTPALRKALAYTPQGFGLYLDLSVAENLALFADLHGLSRAQAGERIDELLGRTALHGFESRRAGHLSGGMMQKLALACALVSHPQVIFLDEATTGVDPVSRRAFWAMLEDVRAEGVTVLYATANMDEAERCERIGLLEGGRLVREGTPERLARSPTAILLSVHGPAARSWRERLRGLDGVGAVFPVGRRLHVWLEHGDATSFTRRLQSLSPTLAVESVTPTLNDAVVYELARSRGT